MHYLSQLDDAVAQLVNRPEVLTVIDDLKQQLPKTAEPFVWSTVDLQSLTLPDTIRSGWIFVLKKDVPSGCHFHPNSIQNMVMIEGEGTAKIGDGSRQMNDFAIRMLLWKTSGTSFPKVRRTSSFLRNKTWWSCRFTPARLTSWKK